MSAGRRGEGGGGGGANFLFRAETPTKNFLKIT